MARESRRAREDREKRETRASLAFYFAIILVAGQFIGNEALGVPINYLLLLLSGAIIIGVLFGPVVMIEFLRAIRGSDEPTKPRRRDGDDDEAP